MKEGLYYAVAYNWGKINRYQYMVKIGSLQECKQAAEVHQADRAGVFGVAIFSAEGKERSLVEYYSSKYGETEPVYDVSLANYQRIGSLALTLYRRGVVLPDELARLCRHLESSKTASNGHDDMVCDVVDGIRFEDFGEVGQ